MPANSGELRTLAILFAQYGVEAFLESTSALVVVLNEQGELLSCNASFEQWKRHMPDGKLLQDFLSAPSKLLFQEFLKSAIQERTRRRTNLEFQQNHRSDFSCMFIPLPDRQVLFVAEPVRLANDLESISAELQQIKRTLAVKETELKAVLAQADEISHTDALTLLPNRKRIVADLQHEIIFSDRYGTPLAISLLDIDLFKNVNDQYGHVAGDEVLRTLAMEFREHIRHPDTIGRYGGEEFLLVLPHSTSKAAAEQAERLCTHVRSLAIESGGNKISLTISIGIAQYRIQKEDWQSFLSRADAALYQAKNRGRDQWVVSED